MGNHGVRPITTQEPLSLSQGEKKGKKLQAGGRLGASNVEGRESPALALTAREPSVEGMFRMVILRG